MKNGHWLRDVPVEDLPVVARCALCGEVVAGFGMFTREALRAVGPWDLRHIEPGRIYLKFGARPSDSEDDQRSPLAVDDAPILVRCPRARCSTVVQVLPGEVLDAEKARAGNRATIQACPPPVTHGG